MKVVGNGTTPVYFPVSGSSSGAKQVAMVVADDNSPLHATVLISAQLGFNALSGDASAATKRGWGVLVASVGTPSVGEAANDELFWQTRQNTISSETDTYAYEGRAFDYYSGVTVDDDNFLYRSTTINLYISASDVCSGVLTGCVQWERVLLTTAEGAALFL